jgi:TM2 domain-containing membrane protein YozV
MKKCVLFIFLEIILTLGAKTFSKNINFRLNNELVNNSCDMKNCNPLGSHCDKVKDECICNSCYISLDLDPSNFFNEYSKCNYKQYSSTKATIIEFIFPIGFGHFYLGNILNGFLKMMMAYLLICFVYVFVIYYFVNIRKSTIQETSLIDKNTGGNSKILINTMSDDFIRIKKWVQISQMLFIIFHIYDLYLFVSKSYKDENNIDLC